MKLQLKIKNPADAYALKFVAGVAALVSFELLFRIVAVDEILIQVLVLKMLGAAGLHRHLKRLKDD